MAVDWESLIPELEANVNTPTAIASRSTRDRISEILGIEVPDYSPVEQNLPTPVSRMPQVIDYTYTPKPKKPEASGIFDVPLLGTAIRALDFGRSIAVSTVKEVGDLFVEGQNASLSEWWDQANRHMMMGEVMRDWNIAPDNPVEAMILGLAFDIALDPLTYMAGAGLVARSSNAKSVANALARRSNAARNAGNIAEADRLMNASSAVQRSGSILAGGEALNDIGVASGLRFTIPATGRIGRTIIEKPLRAMNPRLGEFLDMRRIGQLSPDLVPKSGNLKNLDELLDLSDEAVQAQIFKRMDDIRTSKPVTGVSPQINAAARQAMNMPVEAFSVPFMKGNITAKVTGQLGTRWKQLLATKHLAVISNKLSTKAGYRAMYSDDVEMQQIGRIMHDGGLQANAAVSTWQNTGIHEFKKLLKQAKEDNIDFASVWNSPVSTYVDGSPNPALLAVDPRFSTKEWLDLHVQIFDKTDGFWHKTMGLNWKQSLPFSGVDSPLNMMMHDFYSPHYLTDEGFKFIKNMSPDDPLSAAQQSGVTGLRGSNLMARTFNSPSEILEKIKASFVDFQRFNDGKEYRRLLRQMGLRRDVGIDEFSEAFLEYANRNPVMVTVPTRLAGRRSSTTVHNMTGGGRNVMDPDKFTSIGRELYPTLNFDKIGEASINTQARLINELLHGTDDYVELFSKDPEAVFVRYITGMGKSLRMQFMLDYMQEAGVIARTSKGVKDRPELLRDDFEEFEKRMAFLRSGEGGLMDMVWAGTPLRTPNATKKYWGTVRQQERVDTLARQLNDYEEAVEWITNLRATGEVGFLSQYGGVVSQASIRRARDLVADLATVDLMADDLTMALNAILRGSMEGINENAKILLQGEELVQGLRTPQAKTAYKKLLDEPPAGLPQKAKLSVTRPATAKPTTQELADGFKDLKKLQDDYEDAGQIVSDLYGVKARIDAIMTALKDEIALVGIVKPTTSRQIKQLYGVDDGLINRKTAVDLPRPKTMRDVEQTDLGGIIDEAAQAGFDASAFGPTPSQYLNIFTRRIESKVRALSNHLDNLQNVLAKNIVETHPTTNVANLLNDIRVGTQAEIIEISQLIKNVDNGTLTRIRNSIKNLQGAGTDVVRQARNPNNPVELPADLTEKMIRAINAALRGGKQVEGTYARSLPINILEQIGLQMTGKGAGAVRQWVKSVKELEDLALKLDNVTSNNLTPALDDATRARGRLYEQVTDGKEAMGRLFLQELEVQIAKGQGSKLNRQTAQELGDWLRGLERIRSESLQALDQLDASWGQRLSTARADLMREEDALRLMQERVLQQWDLIAQENARYRRLLNSPTLKDRVRAAQFEEDALKSLNDQRVAMGFATAWNEAASKFVLDLTPMPSVKINDNISTYTINNLKGFSIAAGKTFTREQAEAFQAMFQAAAKTFDVKAVKGFAKNYLTLVNWWKAMAISTTGFILRNTAGGFWVNNQIADVPLSYHTRVLGIRKLARDASGNTGDELVGLAKLIDENKSVALPARYRLGEGSSRITVDELRVFKEWYETGVANSGQVSQEIRSAVADPFNARRGLRVSGATINPLKAEFYPAALIRSYNQDAEFMLRGALAHHQMMTGNRLDDAFATVEKFHFNYSDLTGFERQVKMAIPFWTWQKNVIPILLESMGRNPKAWARLQQVKGNVEFQSDAEGIVPDYFAENMGIRTPWSYNNNRVYVLPDLPFRDMSRWLKEADKPQDFWKSPVRAVAESSLPWMKLPIELWAGKQTFADIPLTGRYQQAPSWADIPALKQALQAIGWLKINSNGDMKMRDTDIYKLDQFYPLFGRIRRLVPNEEGKQERWFTTFINTFLGAGLRMNTPRAQRGQMIQDQVEISQTFRDMVDLETREL